VQWSATGSLARELGPDQEHCSCGQASHKSQQQREKASLAKQFKIFPSKIAQTACEGVCTRAGRIWTHLYVSVQAQDSNEVNFKPIKKFQSTHIGISLEHYHSVCNFIQFQFRNYFKRAYPVDCYPCKTRKAASMMHMIMNNLDPVVAQFPEELITYGGNGQVFSNWAQVIKTKMKYSIFFS
jgi:hypothetical protein